MVAVSSRRLIHNLNEISRLENDHFVRLGQGETKTVHACGGELKSLALHYKHHVGSRRVGIERESCREMEDHFQSVAEAMEQLHARILDQPPGLRNLYRTYEQGHAAWSTEGPRRSSDANHAIMQLWHDGHASEWFLADPSDLVVALEASDGRPVPGNRLEELVHLAGLMRRLASIYQALHQGARGGPEPPFDEKDALVSNLAELIRRNARPVLHTVGIATSIHAWATGDVNPQQARFMAAYQAWKIRPRPESRRRP
jgi:hypothetical protein